MSNPYNDWATADPSGNNHQENAYQPDQQNNQQQNTNNGGGNDYGNSSGGGNNSYGGGNDYNGNSGGGNNYNSNSGGGGNSYGGNSGGGGYNGGGNNYKGGGGGFNQNDIPIPGKYVPVTINIGKEMPEDKRELLNMMIRDCIKNKFTIRCGTTNDATKAVRGFYQNNPDAQSLMKIEYVRPWKKFEVEAWADTEDCWYPTLPVTKSCELLIPKLGDKSDKSRSFKVLEGALIMGRAAKQTARVLITYSPDGMTRHTQGGKDSAYMQNVVRFAQMFGVKVINLGAQDARQQFGMFLSQFESE